MKKTLKKHESSFFPQVFFQIETKPSKNIIKKIHYVRKNVQKNRKILKNAKMYKKAKTTLPTQTKMSTPKITHEKKEQTTPSQEKMKKIRKMKKDNVKY